MKRKLPFLTIFSILFFLIEAGFAQVTFQKTYGSASNSEVCVQLTSGGGYIIAGTVNFGAGLSDIYLVKTDVYGDTLWTKTFGGSSSDLTNSVQQVSDGGYIIAGLTNGFGPSGLKCYLIKTDSSGNLIWSKIFKPLFSLVISSVTQTSDSGYIIAGSSSPEHMLLIKTDASGDTLWTKTLGGTMTSMRDDAYCIRQTNDSGYIIAGRTQNFGAGGNDVFLVKTNAAGDWVWAKTYGGLYNDEGHSVQQTFDGGYIIAGWTGFGSGSVYLIKTDATGDTAWTKTFRGIGNSLGYSVRQTADSGYVVAGYTDDGGSSWDAYLVRTDVSGNLLWSKTYGSSGSDAAFSACQTMDGGFVIAGSNNNGGICLIKTEANGNSFCNETNPITVEGSPPTQVTSPLLTVGHPNLVIMTPATMVGSGVAVTTLCFNVGVNEIADKEDPCSIFPNPFFDKVWFHSLSEENEKLRIRIYNEMGVKVFERETLLKDQQIDLSNLSRGIYFLNVRSETFSVTKKIVKL